MQDFQQRVVDEKLELDGRLGKLTGFLSTAAFESLDEAEQKRLARQAEAMMNYSTILGERIVNFKL